MKIAILARGSLIWDPRELKEWIEDDFKQGGPELPIEFSRISKDHRLTLVIDPIPGTEVPTRFVLSKRSSLSEAVEDLRERESTNEEYIGFTDITGAQASFRKYPGHQFAHERIRWWLDISDFHAVIWTALPSNYRERERQDFSDENAVSYLLRLSSADRQKALEYVRKAPAEVQTPVRTRLEQLGLV
jgi:hypothetical protein